MTKEGKFVYSSSDEYFVSDLFETKEKAIEHAKNNDFENSIYVGVVKDFDKKIDIGDYAIERLEEHVFEECGIECGISVENIKELDEMLWQTFSKWLKKHKEFPNHYKVIDIEKVELEPSETGSRA